MEKTIGEQIEEITKAIDDKEFISKASNEELVAYLFLAEKMKRKLEKLAKLEDNK